MAKLARKLLTLFGIDGSTGSFEQFGSNVAGAPVFTKDVLSIQTLDAWKNGWQNAVFGTNKAPFLEDMNAWMFVHSYMATYMLQEGVPEYDSTTSYFIGGIVKKTGTSELYKSLTNDNLGNALPSKTDNANWQYVINKGILQYDSAYTYASGEIAQKVGTAELYMSLVNGNVGNALPNQTTSAVWKYLADLANLAPPPVGVSSVQFGFANVVLTTGTGQSFSESASVTKNPVGDFGFNPSCTVYAFAFITQCAGSLQQPGVGPIQQELSTYVTISGTGVDSSTKFLNGGSPSTTYTLTLSIGMVSNTPHNPLTARALIVFIGVK